MNKEKKGNDFFKMSVKNKSPKINSNSNVSPFSQDISKSNPKKNIEIQKNKTSLKNEDISKNSAFNEHITSVEKNERNLKNIYFDLEKNIIIINNNINSNDKNIEKLENALNQLKQEKNSKKSEIVNLLSNKESLDEIYNNYIEYLKNKNKGIFIKNKKINNNIKSSPFDNQDEDAFEILISEIKEIDLNKFIEQTFNFIEDIFDNPNQKLKMSLKEIITKSYSLFNNAISSSPFLDTYSIVSNFFLRISLFLSNQSCGKYSETIINLFLRCLLKMNSINVKNEKLINYMNTDYKEEKGKLKHEIYSLISKNEILEKNKKVLENQMKDLEIKLKIRKNIEYADYNNFNTKLNSNTKEPNFTINNYNLDNNNIVYFRTESKNEINTLNKYKNKNKKNEIKEKLNHKFKKIYKEDIIETKTNEDILDTYNLNYTNDSATLINESKRASNEKQESEYNNKLYDNFIGKINKINLYEKFNAQMNPTKIANKVNSENNEKYSYKYNTKSNKENQIDKDILIKNLENNIKKYNTINNYNSFSKKNISKKEYISPQINNKIHAYYKNNIFNGKNIKNQKILDRIYYNKKFKVINKEPKKKLNYHYYTKKVYHNIISYNDINKNMKCDLAKKIKYLNKVNKTNTSSTVKSKNISKNNKDIFLNEQNIKYKRLLTEKKEKKFKYNFFDIIQETNKKRNNSGENKFKNINNLIQSYKVRSNIKSKTEKNKNYNIKENPSNNKNYEHLIRSDFTNERIKSYYDKNNFQISTTITRNGIENEIKFNNGSDSPFSKNDLSFSKKYIMGIDNKVKERRNIMNNKKNLEINSINNKINRLNNRNQYYHSNKNTYTNSGKKNNIKNDYKFQLFRKEKNLNNELNKEIKKNNIYFIITESRNNIKNNKIFSKLNKNENMNEPYSQSKSNRSEISKNRIMEKGFNSCSKAKNRISNFNYKFNKTLLLKRSLSSSIYKLLNNNLKKKNIIDSFNEFNNNNSSSNNSFNISNPLGVSYINNKKGKDINSYIDNSNKSKINKEAISNLKIGLKNSVEIHKDSNEKKNNKKNNIIKISNNNLLEDDFNSLLNKFKNNQKETFCYFKSFEDYKYNKKFNPLENCSINPENLGYSEGYISIDVNEGILKIIPKVASYKNSNSSKNFNIGAQKLSKKTSEKSNNHVNRLNNENNNTKNYSLDIKLKELIGIEQCTIMNNIIKIHRIFIKYNSEPKNNFNNIYNNPQKNEKKVLNLNKLLYVREIKEINLTQNEKIKAILCNYFSFSFFYGKYKENIEIELIFINFEQYNLWNNFMSTIIELNKKNNIEKETFTERKKINNNSKDFTHNKGNIENGSNINEDISKISNNDIIIAN